MLQQALADANTAYRNFFASMKGTRKGRKLGAPRFRSKRDRAQSIRFTKAARFRVHPGGPAAAARDRRRPGALVARAAVASRRSVTVTVDAAGRYHASFVVDVPDQPLPPADREVGIDLGLTHFAVLSDGRKVDNPRIARKAAAKLRPAQKELARRQQRVGEPGAGRVRKVARVPCPGRGHPPGLAAQAVDHVDPREPSGVRGRPRRVGPGPHPARPVGRTTRAGRRSWRCSTTRRGEPGGRSRRSTGGSRPPGRAQRVGPSARPSPCTSVSGRAGAGPRTTGTSTPHVTSWPRDARTDQRLWSWCQTGSGPGSRP